METRTEWKYWIDACKDAIQNLNYFRSTPEFQLVIEGTPKLWGEYHLKNLLNNQLFIRALSDLEEMDLFGLAFRDTCYDKRIEFKTKDSTGIHNHCLTPTALRYARNTINILEIFGTSLPANFSIYEIGGGYGGDAKTFSAIASNVNISPSSWNVFDLESSHELIKQSCKHISFPIALNANYPSSKINPKGDGLCFSCGALSEMNGKTLDSYLHNVLLPCDFGYFLCNFDTHSKPYGGISTKDFIEFLKNNGKKNVQELNSFDYFTPYDNFSGGSRLVIFGAEELQLNAPRKTDFIRFKLSRLKDKVSDIF